MNRNPLQTIFSKKFWLVCIAVGIFLLGIVFALSRQADMQNCEQRLAGAIEFIKEQAADYTKYNETAIAKGLVREAAAVHALESLSLDCDEAALSERAKGLWLTGICLLDAQGELVCEYTEDGIGYAQLQSGIKLEPILSVIGYPQKTYVKHVELDDGSFADVAVHSCADGAGAVLAYRYTGAEFSQKSVLSIQPLIDSYGVNSTGTLLVVEENRVSASNDPTLIGMNIFESERLMSIRRSNRADKLIRVYAPKGIEQCYGMYSHGRNYSLYAYVPARQVYDLTVMNLVITLVMYTLDTVGMKNEDVIADPLRLEQILINVLANAVKFTPDGGQISLRIVQKDTASADYADFEFHIKDNGIGMSEEFQKHIFEQFARERTSTVSKIQGTGLGLAITKSLVDMMGGRITVESEPGRGSEFTISLRFPVGEAKAGQMIPVSKASAFTGKKLLVVEDNELNLEIASTLLEEAGFEVDTAGNGKIAVEKIEAASAGRYDLILMDVQMPEMDGYEATRRIRALPDKKKAAIPIVAMTANAFEEDQKNALNVGMNGHIAKPLDIQKLFQVLSELLK